MKFKSAAAMALGLAMVGSGLRADDAKAPAWYANTTVHGYGDVNYQYSFNGVAPSTGTGGRVFDTTFQSFAVNGAKLAIANTDSASGTSGEIDLIWGNMATIYNATAALSAKAVEQAFVTQGLGPVTLKIGKFETFVGNEGTDTPSNLNYSRSILYSQEPFFNVGLSATYAITSSFSLMGYVGDNSSTVFGVVNSSDTGVANHPDFGAQIVFTGVKGLSLTGTYYNQPNGPFIYATSTGLVSLYSNIDMFNFVGSYQITDSLALAGEYLYTFMAVPSDASQTLNLSAKTQGYALYLDWKMGAFSIDPRFEQFFMPDYFPTQQANEFTLTFKYAKGPLTHYLELRDDATPNTTFLKSNSPVATTNMTTMQNTITYAAVYSF